MTYSRVSVQFDIPSLHSQLEDLYWRAYLYTGISLFSRWGCCRTCRNSSFHVCGTGVMSCPDLLIMVCAYLCEGVIPVIHMWCHLMSLCLNCNELYTVTLSLFLSNAQCDALSSVMTSGNCRTYEYVPIWPHGGAVRTKSLQPPHPN